MYVEHLAVEGVMQSVQLEDEFALRANLDTRIACQLPSWYLFEDDGGNIEHALYLDKVYE